METVANPIASTPRTEAVFDMLLGRRSHWPLTEPAPSDAELDLIFDTALRAPDHGRLQPWRFALIRGEARAELGEVLVDIAAAREPGTPRAAHEHRRQRALAAPVIIALGVSITRGSIPASEQLLCAGAAAMNMLNAIHALGYGGFWATGADSYDATLKAALDFEAEDTLIGFLFVGTPKTRESAPPRPPRANHVREWFGRASI
ncbi:nitroreductase [Paraburkholderia sp. J41]|uniref:nitroreductase family protein n=1 Tax=Paraburkholderia sp. J41 TaxID=2805433 RepID=UPI002AC33D60|nr:nitroreductase [Paraburkholderia sp. J41]